MTVQLFGISKAALYLFLPPAIDILSLFSVAMAVDLVLMVLPDVANDYFG